MIENNTREFWLALQITDASFPSGALANSQGLESAMYAGLVDKTNLDTLSKYAEMLLRQAVFQLLPFVRTAWEIARSEATPSEKLKSFQSLDNYCHCVLSNEVARRASINQGHGFLRISKEALGAYSPSDLNESRNGVTLHTHFSPIFGWVCGILGVSMSTCDRMFLRMMLRDVMSAASRLNIVGPIEASRQQFILATHIEKLLSIEMKVDELVLSNTPIRFYMNIPPRNPTPIIDLIQSRHDTLYSRLFNS